jgi:hypothetical protein
MDRALREMVPDFAPGFKLGGAASGRSPGSFEAGKFALDSMLQCVGPTRACVAVKGLRMGILDRPDDSSNPVAST